MKKVICSVLALVVLIALSVPALAAGNTQKVESDGNGTANAEVKATFQDGAKTDPTTKVYLINVSWEVSSTIKYTDGETTYTWNAEDTQYTPSKAEGVWSGDATVTVTVENKSNDKIKASAAWKDEAGYTTQCTYSDNQEITVDSAAKDTDPTNGSYNGAAQSGTITAKLATPTAGTISEETKIGTLTITIAPAAGE